MKRKCIWLRDADYHWLRQESERTGVPMTRIIHRIIAAAKAAVQEQTKGTEPCE